MEQRHRVLRGTALCAAPPAGHPGRAENPHIPGSSLSAVRVRC